MTSLSRSGFIALVGPANAGKSTLLNTLLGQKVSIVSAKPHTTRDRIIGIAHVDGAECIFVDSPGFCAENYNGALSRYLRKSLQSASTDVDLALLVLDSAVLAKNPNELATALKLTTRDSARLPDAVVLNKIDTLTNENLLALLKTVFEGVKLGLGREIDVLPLSAKKGLGTAELLKFLAARLPEGPHAFPADIVTDSTDSFVASEIIREKLFAKLKQELPYSSAVRVEKFSDESEIIRINASILVERDSQKGIVIGSKGVMIKEIGTLARMELEKIFEKKVHLELVVKVVEDWTSSDRGLQRVGYNV